MSEYKKFRIEYPNNPEGENVEILDATKLFTSDETEDVLTELYNDLEVLDTGNLSGKALLLPTSYGWMIGKDSEGRLVLVPLKMQPEQFVG